MKVFAIIRAIQGFLASKPALTYNIFIVSKSFLFVSVWILLHIVTYYINGLTYFVTILIHLSKNGGQIWSQ